MSRFFSFCPHGLKNGAKKLIYKAKMQNFTQILKFVVYKRQNPFTDTIHVRSRRKWTKRFFEFFLFLGRSGCILEGDVLQAHGFRTQAAGQSHDSTGKGGAKAPHYQHLTL